ncbi:MAG TPA: choice-of-anchor X domain-containing protein [Thermoanaerobaculia bacterium]
MPELDAPIPPPEDVFIQKRDNADGMGNAFVLVRLTPEQLDAKRKEGTADFLTLSSGERTVILRDDGVGGDVQAGDGLFTGIGEVDLQELQARAAADSDVLAKNPQGLIPFFQGRAATGVVRPAGFDFASFERGIAVTLPPRVAFLRPESPTPPPITSKDPIVPGTNIFQEEVLMITDTDVVTDPARTWNPCTNTGAPAGVWTFNHLMTQMANQPFTFFNPSDFVQTWLERWTSADNINGDPLPARGAMQDIIDEWPKLTSGKLDLAKSPLRLLAIVPRVDLRGGGGGYGGGGFDDAGELRFIFGFVAKSRTGFDPTQEFVGAVPISGNCYALPFTVIFEYLVPKTGCQDVRAWAKQWVNLETLDPSTTTYRSQLQSLTQQIVVANANPNGGNRSALRQLRTNEVALAAPWELREFRLNCNTFPTCQLTPSTVQDTIRNDQSLPDDFNEDANGTGLLAAWIQTIVEPALVSANNHEATIPQVPLSFQSQTFRAGKSQVIETNPNFITFHWGDQNNLNVDHVASLDENWARHRVSRASCNGCHRRDTFTPFTHVNPSNTIILSTWSDTLGNWSPVDGNGDPLRASPTLPAELSLFLTGINQLGDPANARANTLDERSPNQGNPKRNFDDLARRELDINNVAGMSCFRMVRANMEHAVQFRRQTGRLPENLSEGVSPEDRLSVGVDDMKRNVITEVH